MYTKEQRQEKFDMVVKGFKAQGWRRAFHASHPNRCVLLNDDGERCAIGQGLGGTALTSALNCASTAASDNLFFEDAYFWKTLRTAHDFAVLHGITLRAATRLAGEKLGLDTSKVGD